ncbi:MAG: SDR family oxidoreductase, partial [Chitinophagaceae bacterium]
IVWINGSNIEMIENKVVLVTGGAGFIGSNLCEALLANNNIVRCLDNFVTGKARNIKELMTNPNFTLIEGDIRSLEECYNATKEVDFIFHQAALGSVPRSISDPITTNDVNVSGFLNMLIAARDSKVKRFVYAASSSTYGDSKSLPKAEDTIGKPLSPYAVTKYVNELYANVFHTTYGLDTIGLRYFNVFGRRQDPDSFYAAVIPKFIMQLMRHEAPLVNGDGEYSRDFTYIDDVIQMNLLAVSTDDKVSLNTVYNVAYGEKTTLNQVAAYLKEYLGKYDDEINKISVKYGLPRAGDISHSLASIDKAKQNLGYIPKYSLQEGLKIVVEWYWKNLS